MASDLCRGETASLLQGLRAATRTGLAPVARGSAFAAAVRHRLPVLPAGSGAGDSAHAGWEVPARHCTRRAPAHGGGRPDSGPAPPTPPRRPPVRDWGHPAGPGPPAVHDPADRVRRRRHRTPRPGSCRQAVDAPAPTTAPVGSSTSSPLCPSHVSPPWTAPHDADARYGSAPPAPGRARPRPPPRSPACPAPAARPPGPAQAPAAWPPTPGGRHTPRRRAGNRRRSAQPAPARPHPTRTGSCEPTVHSGAPTALRSTAPGRCRPHHKSRPDSGWQVKPGATPSRTSTTWPWS
jgi:hypothetical protein